MGPDNADNPAGPTPIPCVACGYDLVGLPTHGLCPECATPIERTRPADGLAKTTTGHLKTLAMGLRLVLAGVLVAAVGLLTGPALAIAGSLSPGYVSSAVAATVPLGLLLTAPALAIFGWWVVAGPDPGLAAGDTPWTGLCTRWSAGATVVGAALALVVGGVGSSAPVAGTLFGAVALAGALAGAAGGLVLMVSAHLHVRWLARRAPAPRAATLAARVPIAVLVFLLLALVPRRHMVGLWATLHALGLLVTLVSALYSVYAAHAGLARVVRAHLRARLAHE